MRLNVIALALLALSLAAPACGDDPSSGGSGGEGGSSTSGTGGANTATTGTGASTATTTGSGGCAPADAGCFDYCSFTPTGGVSFADDVMPIFEAHCNATTCHGSLSAPDADLYLGSASGNDAATIVEVYAELVNWDAYNAPGMVRVDPGDPANSWLMVKLDGDMSCPQAQPFCAGSCGQRMPRGDPPLPAAQLDVIRSWIMNGAPSPDPL